MFQARFQISSFSSTEATSRESFKIAGACRVCVKSIDVYEAPLDRCERYVAKSNKPFVVVITTRATGGDAHINGRTRIVVATDGLDRCGAAVYAFTNDGKYRDMAKIES